MVSALAVSAQASTLIPPEDFKNLSYYSHCNLSSGACIISVDKDYAVLTIDPSGAAICDIVIRPAGFRLASYAELSGLHRITPYLYRKDRRLQYKFVPIEQADGSFALSMTAQRGTEPLQGLYLKSPGGQTLGDFLSSHFKAFVEPYGHIGLIAFPTFCTEVN
ncbi:hypothetical protein [Oligoflexus tunisiensis]|uniref:hypothetical protein n=1 Tax=Oligoflexus tunisiensis TaxID=708132 RepID=UPI001C403B61|nr:hypothetical protein [Oligoflexus tunisiensis]